MKKIVLSAELTSFINVEKQVLNRSEFQVFIATSPEDILKTHRKEHADLIILQLDFDGTTAEEICSFIRNDSELTHVSIMIVCNNIKTDLDRVRACRANSYLTRPILREKLTQSLVRLLSVAERQDYRVLLKATVNGQSGDSTFFCTSQNISASGMLIETEKRFEKGDIISCSFFLPDFGQIVAEAEIMRVLGTGKNIVQYGIRYLSIDSRFRTAIETFVKRRSVNS
ncbi:MAG: PilZ domain-containing protein [Nitrospirota bacterium]|nr:PilZ domain-containing protein [Nitrospirota bacterium]